MLSAISLVQWTKAFSVFNYVGFNGMMFDTLSWMLLLISIKLIFCVQGNHGEKLIIGTCKDWGDPKPCAMAGRVLLLFSMFWFVML